MNVHTLRAGEGSVHGAFSSECEPVLVVQDGDVVVFEQVPDVSWGTGQHVRGELVRPKLAKPDGERAQGPGMAGPVRVEGARAGDVLAVEIRELVVGDYGWTMAGTGPFNGWLNEGAGVSAQGELVLWELDAKRGVATSEFGHRVAIEPFPGTIGLCPPGEGWHIGWFPTRHGGNMDWPMVRAGATLYLPVGIDGASFSVGDTHARQSDGECSGTAIECMLARGEFRLRLERELEVKVPTIEHDGVWGTLGVDRDLEVATTMALDAMLDVLERALEVDRSKAMAMASVLVDLRYAQLVNGVRGVYARFDSAALL